MRKLLLVLGVVALAACADPIGPEADLQRAQDEAQVEPQDEAQQKTARKGERPLEQGPRGDQNR